MIVRRITLIFLAVVIVFGAAGFTAQPAYASGCAQYHVVGYGQSLSWIGAYYGVSWTYLAQLNGIPKPYKIYPGQKICISGAGVPAAPQGWSFKVVNVEKDVAVTIRTYNFPDNVFYKVKIGRKIGGVIEWKRVEDLDSGAGGTFNAAFSIPAEFAGTSQLVIRLVQDPKGTKMDSWFANAAGGTGGLGPGYGYGIPTIWIVSVVRNSKVTIRTNNFPAGLTFDVFMAPMGSRGVGGYHVGTLNSGAGGTMEATFSIPSQLYNHYQIAIRTQNNATGYFSYNWFYNNTAY